MTTALTPQRYLELIASDTDRLIAMGERGLRAEVPSCPGWDVAEVVWHVAGVYEHKVRVMADTAWPEPWPPTWEFADDEELAFLRSARAHLVDEFARHDPGERTVTFGDDDTITFWLRRMALEIAVHRFDAELAHADRTPIDPALALDGIDEFLRVMLAADWAGTTEHPLDARVAVESDGVRWQGEVTGRPVRFVPGSSAPAALTVSGEPEPVFLWLWGRAGDEAVRVDGDRALLPELRARLAEAAQ